MKNTEIRIGNIIGRQFFNIANRKIEIRDCICLEPRQSRCLVRLEKSNKAIFYEDLEGIPLTEGWLLRLGFEQVERIDGLINTHKKVFRKGWTFCIRPQSKLFLFDWVGGNTSVKHVHELQNIYNDLTHEELTIV